MKSEKGMCVFSPVSVVPGSAQKSHAFNLEGKWRKGKSCRMQISFSWGQTVCQRAVAVKKDLENVGTEIHE